MTGSPTFKAMPRRLAKMPPPSPPPIKPKGDWTTRRATYVSVIAAVVLAVAGLLLTPILAGPRYVPSTIFQPKTGDKPQIISDLTSESQTCDAAVRSLLLAFANEIDDKDLAKPTDAVAKTKSLVETDLAIVPVACQKLIDPRSVVSDGNLSVGVRSLRYDDEHLKAALTIRNKGTEPIGLTFEDNDANVGFTDDKSSVAYTRYKVRGVHNCWSPYCTDWTPKATRVSPGGEAIVTVEADNGYIYGGSSAPNTASLALTLLSVKPDGKTESLSFGFHDVPVDK